MSLVNEQKQLYGMGERYNTTSGADMAGWMSVVPGKRYYVSVKDFSNRANDNAFSVRLEYVPVIDSDEPNNTFGSATPIVLGTPHQALYYHPGSTAKQDLYDHYKFNAPAPGRLKVALTKIPKEVSIAFDVFNSAGQGIQSKYSTTRGADLIITTADSMPADDYIVRVSDFSSQAVLGAEGLDLPAFATIPYQMTVTSVP